ncbi:carbohydrate kinase (thermoresistant glucokinase family) [Sinomonas atrocyanea]|uniref:gluconokinase n=1 Tax=Sinomonas atrocyanea TaxID=37927 RepID=UPI00278A5A7E|nr:gluconokinase [Sinomonas atrocyanea]MDP9884190.1 carbohydrate kinase (thermoresistant glucokinase family) [Sinomonas atrocyanea]
MIHSSLPIVVMGVSGSGKSTVGRLLAHTVGGRFIDGDELHPESNVAKMAAGTALTDRDREPWLHEVGQRLRSSDGPLVIACSALRRTYRDIIRAAVPRTRFVHLEGTRDLLAERMSARPGHFMPRSLLESQIETLEPLEPDELGIVLDIAEPPTVLAAEASRWVSADSTAPGSAYPADVQQKVRS